MNPVQRLLIIGIVQDEIAFGVITAFQNNNKYRLVCISIMRSELYYFFPLTRIASWLYNAQNVKGTCLDLVTFPFFIFSHCDQL